MNRLALPEVRVALEAILHAAQIVRLKRPELPPLRRLQEARRYCVAEILMATVAITKAEELAQHGAWKAMPASNGKGEPRSDEYQVTRKEAAAERDQRIRKIAAAHPDWTHVRIAERLGCGRSTVGTALRSGSKECADGA